MTDSPRGPQAPKKSFFQQPWVMGLTAAFALLFLVLALTGGD